MIKILAKNHQYLGVNNTIASLEQIEDNQGKLGVFWHTQGSGKSISMLLTALPNAAFIAFTGTPLMAGEEKTRSVFGNYVSVYDFNQSILDRATVPLYYENRVPTLQLLNEDFNEDIEQILEDAELDAAQKAKLEHEFAREYHPKGSGHQIAPRPYEHRGFRYQVQRPR